MNKIQKVKDKMGDVFYAMKRENEEALAADPQPNTNPTTNSHVTNGNITLRNRRRGASPEEVTDSDGDSDINSAPAPPSKPSGPALTRRQKFWKRFYSTWLMIAFFFMIIYLGHAALCLLVTVFQAMGFREIAALGSKPRIEKQLPNFYLLHWHFFLSSIFFLYGNLLAEHLLIGIFDRRNLLVELILRHHGFISFTLLVSGIIWFVLSLKKGFYKYQFKQLGWCLATIIVVVVQSTFVMRNIMDGIIWFFVPAVAVITNDIMAYMCGRAFGKRFIKFPLIKLSPNKTWEGAIGACFFTLIITYGFASLLIRFEFMICPKRGFGWSYPTCEPSDVFVATDWDVFGLKGVSPFQLHSVLFALYASLIGPFGGFFASGFKRAFKLKDFSQSVGYGHGGVLDRMDCQIMMCIFIYVYRQSFVVGASVTGLRRITKSILRLSREDQLKLLANLQDIVGQQ